MNSAAIKLVGSFDLFIYFPLWVADLVIDWFYYGLQIPLLLKNAIPRLLKRAFRSRTDRSELNLAFMSTLLASVLILSSTSIGGRDVLLDTIGKICDLSYYAYFLLFISILMHLGMILHNYLLRCIATWLAALFWTFTAGTTLYKYYLSLIPWVFLMLAWVAHTVHHKIEHDEPL